MKKINLKGVNAQSVTGVVLLVVALVNATLQMFGYNTLPITNDDVSGIVSSVFVILTAAYSTYKNLNVSTASQVAQQITDLIKNGELLTEDVEDFVQKFKKQ